MKEYFKTINLIILVSSSIVIGIAHLWYKLTFEDLWFFVWLNIIYAIEYYSKD